MKKGEAKVIEVTAVKLHYDVFSWVCLDLERKRGVKERDLVIIFICLWGISKTTSEKAKMLKPYPLILYKSPYLF